MKDQRNDQVRIHFRTSIQHALQTDFLSRCPYHTRVIVLSNYKLWSYLATINELNKEYSVEVLR